MECRYFQVSSAAPLDKQTYDLIARVPPGTTKEQFRAMLRNLLEDRLVLKTHVNSKEFKAYELVVAKSGPKLSEVERLSDILPLKPLESDKTRSLATGSRPKLSASAPDIKSSNSMSGGYLLARLSAQQQPISNLVRLLRPNSDLPIVDQTGLTGKYSFRLEYTFSGPGSAIVSDSIPSAPDLVVAIEQQLGLKLLSTKLPFDVVFVESFNNQPKDN